MDDRTADYLFNRFAELLDASTARLERRIDGVQSSLGSQIDDVHAELREFRAANEANYDGLAARFDAIDERFNAVDRRFDRLENRLAIVEHSVSR